MKVSHVIISLFAFLLIGCSHNKSLFVDASDGQISYWGRIDSSGVEGVDLYWSGTSIKMNFEGGSIAASFKDEAGDNYYNVIIDNNRPVLLRPDTIKQNYQLASGLSEGAHSIEIFKRTEWDRGKATFFGFTIGGKANLLPKNEAPIRKLEFYGNSITAGYAVEDTTGGDSPDSTYTNNYLSYAAITARNYKAQYQCICKSGIGITVSWFPLTMPQMYNRLVPTDDDSHWDFSLYTPDVVVVNLMQNDSWLVNMPNYEMFQLQFGNTAPDDAFMIEAYQQFVSNIRQHYPQAHIICMLGNMDATQEGSKWPSLVQKAVSNLNDQQIYTHFVSYKNTPGHPTIKEQEVIANSLIQFIDNNIVW